MKNSPYLDLPLRTLAQARADRAARHVTLWDEGPDTLATSPRAVQAKLQRDWGFR